MAEQSIELDCPPGSPRPGDLIEGVIEGLGLDQKEPIFRIFGNWKWDYSEVEPDRWEKVKPTLAGRIQELYQAGLIRYGSW
jgi:hypothetical protein